MMTQKKPRPFDSIVLLGVLIFLLAVTGSLARTQSPAAQTEQDRLDTLDAFEEIDEFEDEFTEKPHQVRDPLIRWNRLMFRINDTLYYTLLKPAAKRYNAIMPKPARLGIRNVFRHITTPVRFVNCLLQGKGREAGTELERFAINTIGGGLGFGDPARIEHNLNPSDEDLGQTLAVWGIGEGFFLMWPLIGPSTLRDTIARSGDRALNPTSYIDPWILSAGLYTLRVTNSASLHLGEYEAITSDALDPYIILRNAYFEYRRGLIEK